jgi:hypothetical protein
MPGGPRQAVDLQRRHRPLCRKTAEPMTEHVPPSTFRPREPRLGKYRGLAKQRTGPSSDLLESVASEGASPYHRHTVTTILPICSFDSM